MKHIRKYYKEIIVVTTLLALILCLSGVVYMQGKQIASLENRIGEIQAESSEAVEKAELLRSGYQEFYSQFQDSALLQEDTVATLLGAIEVYDNNVTIYEDRFTIIENAVIENSKNIETLAQVLRNML